MLDDLTINTIFETLYLHGEIDDAPGVFEAIQVISKDNDAEITYRSGVWVIPATSSIY